MSPTVTITPTYTNTIVPTPTITPTFTPELSPTSTFTPFPTKTPTIFPTLTQTPMVTNTPTNIPTPTSSISISLKMPSNVYHSNDLLWLRAVILNKSEQSYLNIRLFVFLDIDTGEYWFYPSWTHYPPDFDSEVIDIYAKEEITKEIIKPFYLPQLNQSIENCKFWGALTDFSISYLITDYDEISFSIYP